MTPSTRQLTRAALLLALALVIQWLKLPQPVTGPVVNAILLLSVPLAGGVSGILIGLVTPLVALLSGIMPIAPLVPFIMIGNATIVVAFAALRRVNSWLAAAVSAVLKYAWLTASASFLVTALTHTKVPPKIVAAFGLPQLYTALAGGLIAMLIMAVPAFKQLLDPTRSTES